MSTILAWLLPFAFTTERDPTYDHDNRCRHCQSGAEHGATDHDEAIFESYRGIGEP